MRRGQPRVSARALRSGVPVLVAALFLGLGCSALIAPYNETAYRNATSLKPEALALMGRAAEQYSDHEADVDALMLKVEQAYEYANGLPRNSETTDQWKLLKDPEGNLLGGFMKRWQDEGTLGAAFIEGAQDGLVGPAFDLIIGLEVLKIKN